MTYGRNKIAAFINNEVFHFKKAIRLCVIALFSMTGIAASFGAFAIMSSVGFHIADRGGLPISKTYVVFGLYTTVAIAAFAVLCMIGVYALVRWPLTRQTNRRLAFASAVCLALFVPLLLLLHYSSTQ